jgi:molybdopterin converting factor subunit 1
VRVNVRLFALAKQVAGRGELWLDLPENAKVADLRRALAAACPKLAPLAAGAMIAVAAEYAADDQPIGEGDEVAVIPPVSGGAPHAVAFLRFDQ